MAELGLDLDRLPPHPGRTRGSGGTSSPSPSPPRSPGGGWSASATATTSTSPQQSIRTFFNATQPAKHYVKTALSVLNMGFMRGLSAAYMEATPAINDWLAELVDSDAVLADAGFEILRERAAVGYRTGHYEAGDRPGSPYRKMLAALWRESPVPRLGDRRAARDDGLAAARRPRRPLARGRADRALGPGRRRSGCAATSTPTCARCCTASTRTTSSSCRTARTSSSCSRTTSPRARSVKDIAEEIVLMDPDAELPPAVERIRAEVPDELKLLSILTDVVRLLLPLPRRDPRRRG